MKNKLPAEEKISKKTAWQERLSNKGNIIKTDRGTQLCPRCIFDDQDLTLSSEGYFTPCCWLDDELYRSQPYVNDFFKPHLNIENHENIQDIFDSDEWSEFWNILLNKPQEAPPVCWEYCASKIGDKEIVESGDGFQIVRKH